MDYNPEIFSEEQRLIENYRELTKKNKRELYLYSAKLLLDEREEKAKEEKAQEEKIYSFRAPARGNSEHTLDLTKKQVEEVQEYFRKKYENQKPEDDDDTDYEGIF